MALCFDPFRLKIAPTKRSGGERLKVQKWLGSDGLRLLRGWARSGLDDQSIAERMNVDVKTLLRWRRRHPDIAQALEEQREVVDYQVEDALLKKALGYQSAERKVEITAKGERKEVETVKQVGPDVSAINLWLKKRKPECWGDSDFEGVPPENNLLAALVGLEGEAVNTDGISELQSTAEADHALVESE